MDPAKRKYALNNGYADLTACRISAEVGRTSWKPRGFGSSRNMLMGVGRILIAPVALV
jgi:hypothetical protein